MARALKRTCSGGCEEARKGYVHLRTAGDEHLNLCDACYVKILEEGKGSDFHRLCTGAEAEEGVLTWY